MLCAIVAVTVAAWGGPVSAKEAFEPTWESLCGHEVPEWLLDAKFGIYTHWGVYCVPAYQTEWYAKRMYDEGSSVHKHHIETWGDPKAFGYRKFVPLFKAEHYDPAEWARLMKATGARYAGMAVVHHDGFLLWDSDVNRWNAGKMGPKRDCYGQYVRALRAEGLKTIATFHHIRTFNWYLPAAGGFGGRIDPAKAQAIREKGWDLTDPQYGDLYWNELAGCRYEDFLAEWQAKVREVIDKYRPDLLWFDGGLFRDDPASERIALDLLAYYHNRGAGWGKPVEVLNKLPTRGIFNFPRDYGVLTFEQGRDRLARVDRPWIDDMKISYRGWCYVQDQRYKSANEVIDGLIDRVARGGGLLFNFSPKADGSVPAEQKKTMLEIGRWLRTNGQAIYATRPWKVVGEGNEAKLRARGWKFIDCDASDVRFTRSKDASTLYAIVLGYPKGGKLRISTLSNQTRIAEGGIESVTLIDGGRPVQWQRNGIGLFIEMPSGVRADDLAYAFRIEVDGQLDLGP